MADPLLELLLTENTNNQPNTTDTSSTSTLSKYLSRLLSLRPTDLTTTEPQSLTQSTQTNLLSLQALSSRSHRSTTTSSDQLSTLQESIPTLTRTATDIKNSVPNLDESTSTFAATYSRARTTTAGNDESNANTALTHRKSSLLLSRQADKLSDILELPHLLSTAIASAAAAPSGSANYTAALDLHAHIRRLQILYPDSQLVADIQIKAEDAMKDMTVNLLGSLRGSNIRLASAIRTVGWLRRVVPELGGSTIVNVDSTSSMKTGTGHGHGMSTYGHATEEATEGSFGALFLAARLSTFLSMTEDALAPMRDLADQESEKRLQSQQSQNVGTGTGSGTGTTPQLQRRTSSHTPSSAMQGTQTERYLKRYIEIFREQSFATVQMFRNIFPQGTSSTTSEDEEVLRLPSALASFPLHLVGLLMETLQTYLPNITDAAARESLLVQVLYAANSLGRLGADFSMMISLLDLPSDGPVEEEGQVEPEWYRVIKKHKVQAARLDALASGQENAARRVSQDVAVR
ncbi:hypothetical protein OHC33_004828 [Knufia fluminis]|uniref:Conserved oligomeric Golgi complex subunit 8 n=1 Tax=Knufia fluminis TaxID=191047 RepID=A0AAN8ER72_9EURO|nr:hypothetical protein OHC33_004828 [Knufia fluminis]